MTLIERLRKTWNPSPELMLEAADALERLTAERYLALEQMRSDRKQYLDMRDERDALKADAERYRYLAKTANGYDKKEKLDAHIDSAIQGAKT